ncbi:MAG: hypothetical protein KDD42_06425 [Bdellovibrionales bacterium]|nr:hypothetical protein [Bdellovibrionales bacterium]
MDNGEFDRCERVVVFEQHDNDWQQLVADLASQGSSISLARVHTPEALQSELRSGDQEMVVIDADWDLNQYFELIYQLKKHDAQPAVIIVSESADSRAITELYKHGCQRFIIRDSRWQDELILALRHMLRFRQVLHENEKIRTRLTEANLLLDERNKRLDEFSATLAHDIRGPLGSISMKLEYLLDHHPQGLDQRSSEVLGRALSSCRRLTDLVQAMYEFAKLGSQATKMELLDMNELVGEVLSDLEFDPKLEIEIGVADLPKVWGNSNLLRRVFINLINNAVKYNDKEKIRIAIECQGILDRPIGRFCEIAVEDNGAGIPEGEIDQVFGMFRRGSEADRSDGGAGIGLAVAQRIMEIHFGEIGVQSVLKRGSRFVLRLPLEDLWGEAGQASPQ